MVYVCCYLLILAHGIWNFGINYAIIQFIDNCVASGSRNEQSGTPSWCQMERRKRNWYLSIKTMYRGFAIFELFYHFKSIEEEKIERLRSGSISNWAFDELNNIGRTAINSENYFSCPSMYNKCIHWLDNNAYTASHGESILADNQIPYLEFWLLGFGSIWGLKLVFQQKRDTRGRNNDLSSFEPKYWATFSWR